MYPALQFIGDEQDVASPPPYYVPAEHGLHPSMLVVAPALVAYCPAGQVIAAHNVSPAENVPAEH